MTPAPARRSKTFLIVLGTPVLVLLVLTLAVCWRLDWRARKEARALAAELHALASVRHPRPSHVPHPLPGTFAQALAPLEAELREIRLPAPQMDLYDCGDVTQGAQPVASLPTGCRERLERMRPLMHRVLLTSRAEEAGLPQGVRLAGDWGVPGLWLREFISFAALEVRLQAEEGQADPALETCLDALALSRDLSHGGGESDLRATAHDHELLFPPCATALERASPASARRALEALRHLREAMKSLSSVLQREERVYSALNDLPRLVDAEQARGMPEPTSSPMSLTPSLQERALRILEPLLMRYTFLTRLEDQRQLASLVDLPLAQRTPPLEKLGRAEEGSLLPRDLVAWSTLQTAVRVDRQRMVLDVLLALAVVRTYRAEQGHWPAELPPLHPEHPVLRPTSVRMHVGGGDTRVLDLDEAQVKALMDFIDPEETDGVVRSFQLTAAP